jgi:hypothetical protein
MKTLPRLEPGENVASRVPQFRIESSLLSLVVQLTILLVLTFVSYSLSDSASKEIVLLVQCETQISNESELLILAPIGNEVPSIGSALLSKYGGSAESEAAVARALIWIANHQAVDGGWTFAHDQVCNGQCGNPGHFASSRNGATAMALLPFLGAGQTHREGQHKDVVKRGIEYLLSHQQQTTGSRPTGSWYEAGGTMYSHCLASIAICEAYAMTADSTLQEPAQLSLNFLVQTQDRSGGGWRYEPKQAGDMSVVGWAVMALKSGKMGALEVPATTLKGVNRFLSSVSSHNGSNYGYVNQRLMMDGGRPTTAIGLLCRMYQGTPQTNAPLVSGARQLAVEGPRLQNLYGTYYTAQVLRHLGGAAMGRLEQRNARSPDRTPGQS